MSVNDRVRAAACGKLQFADLNEEERTAAHDLIDAEIANRASTARFGEDAADATARSGSLDDAEDP